MGILQINPLGVVIGEVKATFNRVKGKSSKHRGMYAYTPTIVRQFDRKKGEEKSKKRKKKKKKYLSNRGGPPRYM